LLLVYKPQLIPSLRAMTAAVARAGTLGGRARAVPRRCETASRAPLDAAGFDASVEFPPAPVRLVLD
jgi:hypothetical protein